MRKQALLLILLLLSAISAKTKEIELVKTVVALNDSADEKRAIKEFTYTLCRGDKKETIREFVLQSIKYSMLEEVGTFISSHEMMSTVAGNGTHKEVYKENITAITAGIVKTTVLSEAWKKNKKQYYIKAKVSVNEKLLKAQAMKALKNQAMLDDITLAHKELLATYNEMKKLQKNMQTTSSTATVDQYIKKSGLFISNKIYQEALQLMHQQKNSQAIAKFNEIITLHPTFAKAYTGRAFCNANINQKSITQKAFNAITADYTKALSLNPALLYTKNYYAAFLQNCANIQFKKGAYLEAKAALINAKKVFDGRGTKDEIANLNLSLAETTFKLNQLKEAVAYSIEVHKTWPLNLKAYEILYTSFDIVQASGNKQALAQYQKYITLAAFLGDKKAQGIYNKSLKPQNWLHLGGQMFLALTKKEGIVQHKNYGIPMKGLKSAVLKARNGDKEMAKRLNLIGPAWKQIPLKDIL